MNGLICSGGSVSNKVTVNTSGTKIITSNRHLKYIRISNISDEYVTLAPVKENAAGEVPVVFGEGIILAPKGTPGWFIEFNNTNMFYSDFWAITEKSDADLSILRGF